MSIDRFTIASALREIGELLAFRGENAFKARAYERGARSVEALGDEFARVVESKRLTDVPGIGNAIASVVGELYQTGRSSLLEKLRADLPSGVLELAKVPGLGAKKVLQLHGELGVETIDALKAACEAGRVRALKGFGPATERKILDGIARYEARVEEALLVDATETAAVLAAQLVSAGAPSVTRVEVAGALRRAEEMVSELRFVVASDQPAEALARVTALPSVARVTEEAPDRVTVRLAEGLPLVARVVAPSELAGTLALETAAPPHHTRLAELARDRGLTLDDRGLLQGSKRLTLDDERAFYAALGLPYLVPELRGDARAIDEALAGATFDDLVDLPDVQGLVHCHTVWSDGKNTVEEMARAADALGMRYLTITDHSPTAFYANGLDVERLKQQRREIDAVQQNVRVKLLHGTESDILAEGALDFPDEVLAQLDIVIASVHARYKADSDEMTRRLIAVMQHPVYKIWGHALGRLLGHREPFACDVERVLDVIAKSRAAIEINGDPHRLDLAPEWLVKARERGIPLVISTDAHSTRSLGYVRWGVAMARRAGTRKHEVLNTRDADSFARAVRPAA